MNRSFLVAIALVLVMMLHGCTPTISAAPTRPAIFLLRVISAADNATRIPSADVFTIGDQGALILLGQTNMFGEIKIDRSVLPKKDNVIAIVVCHPMFFCGALQTDYVTPRDEMTIALAVVVTD